MTDFTSLTRAAAAALAPGQSEAEGQRRLAQALGVSIETVRKWVYAGGQPAATRLHDITTRLQAIADLEMEKVVEIAFGFALPGSAESRLAHVLTDLDEADEGDVIPAAVDRLQAAARHYGAEIGPERAAEVVETLHIRPSIVIERLKVLQYLQPAVDATPEFATRLAVLALRGDEKTLVLVSAGIAPDALILQAVEAIQGPVPDDVDRLLVAYEIDDLSISCGTWLGAALEADVDPQLAALNVDAPAAG